MSVTEAAPPDHQLVDGVVIFLQDVGAPVQQVVAQRVQLGEVDTQVGDAQKFCGGEKTDLVYETFRFSGFEKSLNVKNSFCMSQTREEEKTIEFNFGLV